MDTLFNLAFAVALGALVLWGSLWTGSWLTRSGVGFFRLGLIALAGALALLLPWRGGYGAVSLIAMAFMLHRFGKVKWFPGVVLTLLIVLLILFLYLTAWASIWPGPATE